MKLHKCNIEEIHLVRYTWLDMNKKDASTQTDPMVNYTRPVSSTLQSLIDACEYLHKQKRTLLDEIEELKRKSQMLEDEYNAKRQRRIIDDLYEISMKRIIE